MIEMSIANEVAQRLRRDEAVARPSLDSVTFFVLSRSWALACSRGIEIQIEAEFRKCFKRDGK